MLLIWAHKAQTFWIDILRDKILLMEGKLISVKITDVRAFCINLILDSYIALVQSLEMSRFCTLEISRCCTVEVDE